MTCKFLGVRVIKIFLKYKITILTTYRINIITITQEVFVMSRSKSNADGWDMIFDDLILESDSPPAKYIKDAIVVTKSGSKFKVSAEDFAELVIRQREIGPENSDIYSCSLNIDFTRIKRDVNRWTNKFITNIEAEVTKMVEDIPVVRKRRTRKPSPDEEN